MILLLAGCGVFGNTAPKLVSINGDRVGYLFGIPVLLPTLEGSTGRDVPIFLDISDPEHDAVNVWFPFAPDGLDFPHDATSGTWHIPDAPPPRYLRLEIVLEDQNRYDPRSSEYVIPLSIRGLDTGDTAPVFDTGR
jgi:hypothetical protein